VKLRLTNQIKNKLSRIWKYVAHREWLLAVIITLFLVLAGSIISIASNRHAGFNPSPVARYTTEPSNKLSYLANWDGVDYINIAKHGYISFRLTNFFPLYPIILNLVNKVIRSPLISGLVISWTFMTGAIFYYLKLIKLYFKLDDNLEALRACLIFILFPTAIYLMAVYTESLFAFLSLGAIYYALKKRYLLAGLLASLATITHINGGFLVILITMILFEQKEKLKNVVTTFIISCLGIVAYMGYLWSKFNNPFEFITAQHDHGWLRHSFLARLGSFSAVDYIIVIAIIASIIYWWKRRKSFAVYSLFYLLIPIIGGQFGGYPRYALMDFPLQFMLFDFLRDKRLGYQILLILFSIGWTFFMLQFAAGYIVG
jgi:hypothetical protein